MRVRSLLAQICCAALMLGAADTAHATWSIVVVDKQTKEVAIASATCLVQVDLLRLLPMVLPERGAAAAQSLIDSGAGNRSRIRNEIIAGTDPVEILNILAAADVRHQFRQYGIVDALGRAATFTGSNAGAYAGGVTGQVGSMAYAIQGNVITGAPVVSAAEAALRDTPGDLPGKLMAAMEAARQMGGDGRCSCSEDDPDGCGSPPPSFQRSAHVGFFVDARRGDTDGNCNFQGCATGSYYMRFNIYVVQPSVDPVLQIQQQFDAVRTGLVGVPDQVMSDILFPSLLPPSSGHVRMVRVELRDWQGMPITGSPTVEIGSDPRDGTGLLTAEGNVVPLGGGVYEVAIRSSDAPGADRLAVRVVDTGFDRYLMPSKNVIVQPRGDLNGDGALTVSDVGPFALALTDLAQYELLFPDVVLPIVGDLSGDGAFGMEDIGPFVQALIAAD